MSGVEHFDALMGHYADISTIETEIEELEKQLLIQETKKIFAENRDAAKPILAEILRLKHEVKCTKLCLTTTTKLASILQSVMRAHPTV